MKEYLGIWGIDVSKDTFDVFSQDSKHLVFENKLSGFKKFKKTLKPLCLCVMEVTGIYHLQLATFLHKNNIAVSVVNPLSIKRFAQMQLKRNKTDKADAKIIAQYGISQSPKLWNPYDKNIEESKDISQALEQMLNIRASLKNKLSGFKSKKASMFLIESILNRFD